MTKFKYYSDASHGWLAVKNKYLDMVDMKHEDFTPYSYKKGDTAYLEEDVDMHRFLDKWLAKGYDFELVEIDAGKRCVIRNYDYIRPPHWVHDATVIINDAYPIKG